jgi:D-beta-D-heptose 7-phosphate kinase/D-beta-D-heptose 1-phosphate adenosyltransferase
MSTPLTELLSGTRRPRILVVGDVMLDCYLWGDVDRVSPEAPIPILRVSRREHRLGGAGSVAAMLAALEADVVLASVTGDDEEGRIVRRLLKDVAIDAHAVLSVGDRATTIKERLLGRTHSRYPQQMIRVDREDTRPIDAVSANRLLESVWQHLDGLDLVLISDYGKGVCAGGFVPQLAAIAGAAGVRVVADPARSADYHRYAGCACITPNRLEAGLATGMRIVTPQEGLEAARRLLAFGVQTAAVTLDRDGIAWADSPDGGRLFPVRPRQVYDITGAGDMVLAALGYCLAAGADWSAAIELANLAGGLEVERLGVVPLTRRELLDELTQAHFAPSGKIVGVEDLDVRLRRHRQMGQRVVMTNGCFDLLHPGHVDSLQQARNQGDLLVVGLNSDRSVRELKGLGRPIIDQQGRAEMLAALACVDYVVVFDDASVQGLVERLMPDVLVKSAQYAAQEVVGHEIVRRYGGRVVLVPMRSHYSTTELVRRAHQTVECG